VEKENEIERVFKRKLQKWERFFSTKTKNKTLLKALKTLNILQKLVVSTITLITPIYRIGLGIKV